MATKPRTEHYEYCQAQNKALILPTICTWCDLIEKVEVGMASYDDGYKAAINDVTHVIASMDELQLTRSERAALIRAIARISE